MKAYINGTGVLSAQRTFDGSVFRDGFHELNGNRSAVVEPDYSQFIDARQIRRMSRIIRMGIVAATLASRESGIKKPDAVITGTAFGCLEDTNSFLSKMVQYGEEMLSPTAFIHSTHNTISSQIGLWFQCHGYNSTYVHRAQSFESALLDSMMLLDEGAVRNILTGGVDEIIDASYIIMDRMGSFRKDSNPGKGVNGSEGAVYFSLASELSSASYACIAGTELFSFTDNVESVERIKAFLAEHKITKPDLIFSGHNGDADNDSVYDLILNALPFNSPTISYKKWCGEYATASAFGTWLAAEVIRNKKPSSLDHIVPDTGKVNSILLFNHIEGKHHSLILIQHC